MNEERAKNTGLEVVFTNNTLTLYTGIFARDFAKAKLSQFLHEQGYFFANNIHHSWQFSQTGLDEQGCIILMAHFDSHIPIQDFYNNYLALDSLFDKTTAKENKSKFEFFLNAFACAQKQNISLPFAGTQAVLVSPTAALFLPEIIYKAAVQKKSQQLFASQYGCYVNPLLKEKDARCIFTVAVLVYRFIAGELPFRQLDAEARTEDYIYANFIPLDFFAQNIESLCKIINNTLESKKNQTIFGIINAFSNIDFPICSTNSLEAKRSLFIKRKKKSIWLKRFFSKYKTSITITIATLLCLGAIFHSIIQTHFAPKTTTGLQPIEVVELFYESYDTLDTEKMDDCLLKGVGKTYLDFATNVYVTSKMRKAYEKTYNIASPEEWVELSEEQRNKTDVFGVHNLRITQQRTIENSEDKKIIVVSYYYFMTLEQTYIFEREEILTLTFDTVWKVSQLETIKDNRIDTATYFAGV